MVNDGVISGFKDGTFRGKSEITRGEFLKLIFSVKNVVLSNDDKNYFSDIDNNSWQKKYINTAVDFGLVSLNNKKFNPNMFLTRVEALKMAILLFKGEINLEYSGNFVDVKSDDWFSKYVEFSFKNNLIDTNKINFYPTKNITRMEVIGILYNISSL